MSEEKFTDGTDEVEGHVLRAGANDEPAGESDDDVEAHMRASTPRIDARVDARVE